MRCQQKFEGLQMVSRENHNVLNNAIFDVLKDPGVLPDSIGSPLKPFLISGSLGGRENLHKPIPSKSDATSKVVGASQMAVEGC